MLGGKVAQNGGHVKPCTNNGSQVQLPKQTYRYLAGDLQLARRSLEKALPLEPRAWLAL